jgi:uncharacterized protein (TIGR03663 family)
MLKVQTKVLKNLRVILQPGELKRQIDITFEKYQISWDFFLLFAIAAVFRFWQLDIKAPHFDEGINGHFVNEVWRQGFAKYDPTNFHGPLYFYLLAMSELILGRDIVSFRILNGIISLAVLGLIYAHKKWLEKGAVVAAFFLAVSPAFVFYSRYAIHETLFVFGQVLFSYGFFTMKSESRRLGYILMTTAIVTMAATKETFFIFLGTWYIAWYGLFILAWLKRIPQPEMRRVYGQHSLDEPPEYTLLFILALGWFALLALFSGFFLYWQGVVDFFTAFFFWSKTGASTGGHNKPFYYWLTLFNWYEWWAYLGLAGSLAIIFFRREQKRWQNRLLALVAFGTWLAYSLIPYKTPWLVLNFLWLLALMIAPTLELLNDIISQVFATGRSEKKTSSIRVADSIDGSNPKIRRGFQLFSAAAVVLFLVAGYTSYRLNFFEYHNENEPYVYVQTTHEFQNVMRSIRSLLKDRPETLTETVIVLNRDTWPIPWVLSLFTNVKFMQASLYRATPKQPMAVLIDSANQNEIERTLLGKWYVMPFQIRHAYTKGFAYLNFDLFQNRLPPGLTILEGGMKP